MKWASGRRFARYAGWWLAALVVAVAVAWQGVSVVATQVTSARPAPLTPEQARAARVRPQPPPSPEPPPPSSSRPPPARVTVPSQGPATTGPSGAPVPTTASTRPADRPERRPAEGGRETATTSASPGTTATSTMTTTSTTAPEQATETRTYRVAGGSVALRFEPSGVSVVWANPNAGFEMSTAETHGNGVAVTFQGASQRSVVEGWWDGGPRDQVREDPPVSSQ